ncbi:tetratricopeptide repeat protein 14 homolog isoform X2 [Dendroctonus ponderosae]|uniref:Uncharacterized protein n=1 Tax=Dendroctonus ponderosae TaxID=77166 RepID=U4U2P7_DENPD|nr:tetratricopeptide repeat protein 14 homolog isoform X2 [Dendroctonus ponderosae]ERL87322.1 hypothetical protein D910_04717 [Dendroctonus ponderosae]KAH1001722.1 hypothetical protein HUJ04_005701 [Dendroctonus ponderosae]KAH1004691.1 hypothetical protein HUJ05_005475 [Dendroctonus ponderosae]
MEHLNSHLILRAVNFHGQQLQKLWEGEFGDNDLARRGIKDLNFQVYGQRQKNLSFQDRGKRLKLQQFIVKKSGIIFTMHPSGFKSQTDIPISEDLFAITPPIEIYINADRQKRLLFFTENVKVGDLILGTIVSKQQSGMMLKVLCTAGNDGVVKYAADINIKAFCPVANVIPAVDRKGASRSYMMNDYVCCEVLEVIADTDKMVCGMKGTSRKPGDPEHRPPLGLISTDDFPLIYKKSLDHKNESFESVMEKSIGFNNPNSIPYLANQMGINDHLTLIESLRGRFPENEYANELRQVQASKWAYRNVADGIDHFKAGKHVEAFQCLNKALNIDPRNVEGLVARGALYANSGNFQKAIEDFETALKLNPSHANARKYMGETLVALGRSYEEENKIEEARKAYQSCLSIIPYHEEAKNSLEFLKNKDKQVSKNLIEPAELLLPNIPVLPKPATDVNDALKQLLKNEEDEKKDKKKKKKDKKKMKKKRHSSSSSSSSSSGTGDSSSSSSSSSSDSSSSSGDSDFKKKKKSRSRREKRENSLSPLSKRMAMMDAQAHDASSTSFNFNKPATTSFAEFGFEVPEKPKSSVELDYEAKVKAFLLETKDDSDYELKIRKFLEENVKWKKGKGGEDKKKKKKKDKKAKKESKKKKRKEKEKLKRKGLDLDLDDHKKLRDAIKKELSKEKKKKHSVASDEDEYFLQKSGVSKRFIESLPDLEELESKLNAYYALEKDSKRSDMSESPKLSLLDSPSPTREQKARQAVAEATASAGKWKMHLAGPPPQPSRMKKKQQQERPPSPHWPPELPPEKPRSRNTIGFDEMQSTSKKLLPPLPPAEKSVSVRKQMAMKEPMAKRRSQSPKKPPKMLAPPPLPPAPKIPQGQVVLDKFGNFRLMTPPEIKKSKEAMGLGGRPPEPPGRPRSDSRSPKRRSRSRSRPSRSRSSSASGSRSRSYRSRSRSYFSRSRSRSGSFYSRSRSRSRSYSGDRRFRRRGGFRGGRNDRGTYYKPRYPNPRFDNRGRGRGGNYYNRDRFDRNFRGRGRPYDNYNNRMGNRRHPRGRYGGNRGGYRDYRDRRYERSRSRDRSRSYSRSPERSDNDSPRRTRDRDASKEKINKYSEGATVEAGENPVRHDGPLSEGEDRDDYTNNDTSKVVDASEAKDD